MDSASQQAPSAAINPVMVGNAFVLQYYHILNNMPVLAHRFYHDISKLGRPEPDGVMRVFSTLQAINERILSLAYGDYKAAEITSVDSQESHNGGVLVVVTGYFTLNEIHKRKFTQTFFLAPQEIGYFVLNDIFRFVDEPNTRDRDIGPGSGPEASISPLHAPSQENHISEQPASLLVISGDKEVSRPLDNGDGSVTVEEVEAPEFVNGEVPFVEIINKEAPDDSQKIAEQKSGLEDVPKISYASVVMKEKTGFPAAVSPPPKPVSKDQDQRAPSDPPLVVESETVPLASDATDNGNNQDFEVEGTSIYVKGLPANANPALLENEFKQFGAIRSGGIQVKSQRGFAYGFVEFEEASAVQKAIEASPIIIGGRKAVVEEKRSTSRGNRGRSYSGSGSGYRSEGARGRGRYGGSRGYNRGEYVNRGYSNRGGGYSNRRGDVYQRVEGGNRVNRGGNVSVNNPAKSVAPRVQATA